MPDVLSPLQILLPDMPGPRFSCAAGFACIVPAQGTPDTRSLYSCIPGILRGWWWHNAESCLVDTGHSRNIHRIHNHTAAGSPSRHRPLVGERWYPSTVKDLFADPWRFVARIRCDHLDFWIMYPQTFKYRVERNAVVYVSGGYLRLQYIPASVTYRMRLVRKAFPMLSLVKQSALRVSAGSNDCFFLLWCTGPVFAVIVLLLILLQWFMCVPSTNTTSGDRYPAWATSSSIHRNTPSITSPVNRCRKA